MRKEYNVTIASTNKELSKAQKVALKTNVSDAHNLDELTRGGDSVIIDPDTVAVLEIHNEKSENKDYTVMVIIDKNGTAYKTGSTSFIQAFEDIAEEMEGEEFTIKVVRKPSKNFQGRDFLTCVLVA